MNDQHESQYFESALSMEAAEAPAVPANSEESPSVDVILISSGEGDHAAGSSQGEEELSESAVSHKRRTKSYALDEEQESKRPKRVDKEYIPLEESSSEEGELSEHSDHDSPIQSPVAEFNEAELLPEYAVEDSAFFKTCKKALSNLKRTLKKAMEKDEFDHIYPLYKIDDDLTEEFVAFVSETLIDWEKFEAPTHEVRAKVKPTE